MPAQVSANRPRRSCVMSAGRLLARASRAWTGEKRLTKACVVVNIRAGSVLARSLRVRREVLCPLPTLSPTFFCRRLPPPPPSSAPLSGNHGELFRECCSPDVPPNPRPNFNSPSRARPAHLICRQTQSRPGVLCFFFFKDAAITAQR